jgi:hypothetical protein
MNKKEVENKKKELIIEKDKWYLKYLENKKNNKLEEAKKCLKKHETSLKELVNFLREM